MALLRAAATDEVAAKRARAVLTGQVAPMVATVAGDPAQGSLRAGLVSSRILGLALQLLSSGAFREQRPA